MIGAFLFSVILASTLGHGISNMFTDSKNKVSNRVEGTDDLYWDHNCVARNIYTNQRVLVHRDKNGDLCAWTETNHCLKNYDRINRINQFDAGNKEHRTGFYLIDPDPHSNDKVQGKRYAEYGTDRRAVIRKLYFPEDQVFALYYMDVLTYELIGPVDGKVHKATDNYVRKKWDSLRQIAEKDQGNWVSRWINFGA